jgi:hypothetical protein
LAPALPASEKRIRLSITLTPAALEALDQLAGKLGVSRAELIEHLILADNRREQSAQLTSDDD